jgi:hypothetical protein
VATSSAVDAIAVTRQAVWLAVGGLVLRVDPATERALVVSEVEAGPSAGRGGRPGSRVGPWRRGLAVAGRPGRTAGRPGPSGWRPSRVAPSWPGSWWWPVRWSGSATRGLGWCGWSTSNTRLLGLGGLQVRGLAEPARVADRSDHRRGGR